MLACSNHKQLCIRAYCTLVAVSDIDQIITAAVFDNIPHMASCACAAVHCTGHGVADNIIFKFGKVAEVLESLGISLADNVGFRVVIKNIN